MLLCWVLGGVIALCGALTVAELAGALPRSGGVFAYLLESYGPLPAFLFGWTELVVIRAAALGAIATIFAEYLGFFVPLVGKRTCAYSAALAIVAHRRDQLRRRAARGRGPERHHRGEVRRAALALGCWHSPPAAAALRISRRRGRRSCCRCRRWPPLSSR